MKVFTSGPPIRDLFCSQKKNKKKREPLGVCHLLQKIILWRLVSTNTATCYVILCMFMWKLYCQSPQLTTNGCYWLKHGPVHVIWANWQRPRIPPALLFLPHNGFDFHPNCLTPSNRCQNTIGQGIIYIITPTYISHYASEAFLGKWHTTCQDFIHAINKHH